MTNSLVRRIIRTLLSLSIMVTTISQGTTDTLNTFSSRSVLTPFESLFLSSSLLSLVTNITVQIMSHDGVNLNTQIFFPSGYSPSGGPTPIGTVIHRTPYGINGLESTGLAYASAGFIALNQDERGRYGSGGNYSFWRYSGNDAADTMRWIQSQPWSNGKATGTGVSADAIQQYVMPMADGGMVPGMMKAQFNIVGMPTCHQLCYQNGGYRTGLVNGWLTEINEGSTISTVANEEPYSTFWLPIEIGNRWNFIDYPIIHVGGWYDIFSTLQMKAYLATKEASNATQFLVMEAGGHCGGGAINWPNASWGMNIAQSFALDLFSQVLDTTINPSFSREFYSTFPFNYSSRFNQDITTVLWYVLGPGDILSTGNFWVGSSTLPTTNITLYALTGDGKLTLGSSSTIDTHMPSNVSFTSDPGNPVPTYGGNNLILKPCGPQNQADVEKQYANYMTSFTSDIFVDPLVITGEILVNIFVASTAIDTDITVKLIDVFPTGESMLIQDGILRMRWRNGSYSTEPVWMIPDTVYNVTVSVGWMSYIVNPLHKLRVTIAGSNYPRFSINYQDGSMMNSTTVS